MKLAFIFITTGLIAGLFYFSIASAKDVETMISGAVTPFDKLDIFSAVVEFNVFVLILISLGFVCFMKLRGIDNA